MKSKHALLAATMMLSAVCAHAQTQAPGLWEHTFKMSSPGGEMEKAQAQMQAQLAAMPPEKRKQIEEMMKSRGVTMGAQGTVTKVCVSKEQAARPAEPRMNADCSRQDVTRSGNTMKYKFECTQPRPMTGEGEMSFVSDKAYSGKSTVTTQVKGQPQQMTMEMSGKWLSADCGEVKPFVMPAK
ncbi:MAG: DUF3617 domain-containing protein [Burkholderiales bacterium]